jgi:hypothetical protein
VLRAACQEGSGLSAPGTGAAWCGLLQSLYRKLCEPLFHILATGHVAWWPVSWRLQRVMEKRHSWEGLIPKVTWFAPFLPHPKIMGIQVPASQPGTSWLQPKRKDCSWWGSPGG